MELFAALLLAPFWVLGVVILGFIGLVVSTGFDRSGYRTPKWYIVALALFALGYTLWPIEPSKIWSTVSGWAFWAPLAIYIGVGLGYSVIEFVFMVRRAARGWAEAWKRLLAQTIEVKVYNEDGTVKKETVPGSGYHNRNNDGTVKMVQQDVTATITFRDMLADVQAKGKESKHFDDVEKRLEWFTGTSARREWRDCIPPGDACDVIVATVKEDQVIEPTVMKGALASCVGAWALLWPAYALSLAFGDLLTELFRAFADFLVKISGRLVKISFQDVFKV